MLNRTIKQARKAAGLSQMELAAKSGISQTYISDLETGHQCNPTLAVVRRLQSALGVSLHFPVARSGQDRRSGMERRASLRRRAARQAVRA